MADDEDAIYIDVIPRIDDSAADSALEKLKDKMSHAGDSIKDSISGAFDHLSDKFGPLEGFADKLHQSISGVFSGKEWDNLGQQAGTALGRSVADSLKDITHGDFGNILGNFDHLGDVLGSAVNKLSDKLDGLQKAGGAIGNVLSGSGSGSDVTDILGGAKDLGFKLPGPLSNIGHAKDVIDNLNQHPGQAEEKASNIWGMGTLENILEKGPRDLGGKIHDWFTDAPAKSPVSDAASDKWSSSVAGAIDISTQDAMISAGSVSLSGGISLPASLTSGLGGGGSSGHGAASSSSSGIGKGGAGDSGSMASLYSGPSILGKGFAGGGILPGDSPGYDNMIGVLPSGKAVGLEGGEGVLNPDAMSKPGVKSLVAMLNNHFDEGTTSVPMDPQNPSLFVPPTQGNKASGGGAPPQQAQLGTGSGAGISGGGIIGAAEQAAVSAAGIAGFGGGAIAAQMAEQEINLAIQKTSQAAAALAAAPFETFGLAGGQMGAPTVNVMGGWVGKFISGALGQMNQIPNVAGGAGSVQPPKQPKQPGEEEQPGQGEKVSMGPKGSKDDPMHVNVTNQPQAPQGGVTSAANMTATMAPLTA